MIGMFNTEKMRFTTPNVLTVFSTREPHKDKLCKDRWLILKISVPIASLDKVKMDALELFENRGQVKKIKHN